MSILEPTAPAIALQTARGNPVDNIQLQEISISELNLGEDLERKFSLGALPRTGPTPRYNCHGLTFANRRTCITEDDAVALILSDDDYIEVPREEVMQGDVIVYYNDKGAYYHSGIVLTKPAPDNMWVPRVCSKWGKGRELVHAGNHSPYGFNVRYYRVSHGYVTS